MENDDIDMCGFEYDINEDLSHNNIHLWVNNNNVSINFIMNNPKMYSTNFYNLFVCFNYGGCFNHGESIIYDKFLVNFFDRVFGFDNFDEQKYQNLPLKEIYQYNTTPTLCLRHNNIVKVAVKKNKFIPETCINLAFKNYNWELIYFFLKNNLVQMTTQKMEDLFLCGPTKIMRTIPICMPNKYVYVIDLMLKNKMKITQKCFDNLICVNHYHPIVIDYKTIFKNEYSIDVSNIINLMYNYGFLITQEQFKLTIMNRLYINDYKKYKLEITKEIEDVCNDILYFPYEEIKVTPIGYKKMIKYLRINELNRIKKKYKLNNDRDIEDLELACLKDNTNLKDMTYLIEECKIQPNFKCLSNILKKNSVKKCDIECANLILDKLKEIYEDKK